MKRIYLIERTDCADYDEYDSVVVISKTPKEAKRHVLSNHYYGINKDNITCELVGRANKRQPYGTVTASFNAG